MKEIDVNQIIENVSRLCIECATYVSSDALKRIQLAKDNEKGLAK